MVLHFGQPTNMLLIPVGIIILFEILSVEIMILLIFDNSHLVPSPGKSRALVLLLKSLHNLQIIISIDFLVNFVVLNDSVSNKVPGNLHFYNKCLQNKNFGSTHSKIGQGKKTMENYFGILHCMNATSIFYENYCTTSCQ